MGFLANTSGEASDFPRPQDRHGLRQPWSPASPSKPSARAAADPPARRNQRAVSGVCDDDGFERVRAGCWGLRCWGAWGKRVHHGRRLWHYRVWGRDGGEVGAGDSAGGGGGAGGGDAAGRRGSRRTTPGGTACPGPTRTADQLIADPAVDVVYVATPPGSHLEMALKVAAAGKRCYMEKPMARNHRECVEMIHTFEARGLPLWVAYYRRWVRAVPLGQVAAGRGPAGPGDIGVRALLQALVRLARRRVADRRGALRRRPVPRRG